MGLRTSIRRFTGDSSSAILEPRRASAGARSSSVHRRSTTTRTAPASRRRGGRGAHACGVLRSPRRPRSRSGPERAGRRALSGRSPVPRHACDRARGGDPRAPRCARGAACPELRSRGLARPRSAGSSDRALRDAPFVFGVRTGVVVGEEEDLASCTRDLDDAEAEDHTESKVVTFLVADGRARSHLGDHVTDVARAPRADPLVRTAPVGVAEVDLRERLHHRRATVGTGERDGRPHRHACSVRAKPMRDWLGPVPPETEAALGLLHLRDHHRLEPRLARVDHGGRTGTASSRARDRGSLQGPPERLGDVTSIVPSDRARFVGRVRRDRSGGSSVDRGRRQGVDAAPEAWRWRTRRATPADADGGMCTAPAFPSRRSRQRMANEARTRVRGRGTSCPASSSEATLWPQDGERNHLG